MEEALEDEAMRRRRRKVQVAVPIIQQRLISFGEIISLRMLRRIFSWLVRSLLL